MKTAIKREIISTLLKAGKSELANRAAKLPSTAAKKQTWEQIAQMQLAKEIGCDPEDIDVDEESEYVRMSSGREEYMVFKNDKEAERYAVDYVQQMLDDEPENFTSDWLENFMEVSPTDKRIIAGEEADNYVEGLDDDRVLDEADMKDDMEELEEEESNLSDQETELESADAEDPKTKTALKKVQDAIKKNEKAKEDLIEKAKESLRESIAEATEDRLTNDLKGYLDDMGMKLSDATFVRIDTEAAAKDAINTDGVAHFLAGYDGNEINLKSGGVAYRTN